MKEFIKKGRCIWCLEGKPKVSFFNEPHTITKKLGATNIGFDICDSCNTYFGEVDKRSPYSMSPELAFKEIFNVMRFLLVVKKDANAWKELKSIYFEYRDSKKALVVKRKFEVTHKFIANLTNQFKRGIYEVFLQEYHRCTENGLDDRFDAIRNFARKDVGDLPIYFMEGNGIYFITDDINNPSLSFTSEVLTDINSYGFYKIWFAGCIFFLAVTPRAELTREVYLRKMSQELNGSGNLFKGVRKMKYVTDLDFYIKKST
ncbi:hypothetical protein BH24BAC1_BH24BAC1_37450 [soil metagenome]